MEQIMEGIVLQTIPHLQKASIIKLYSPSGLFSFFQKTRGKKHTSTGLCSSFCQVELIYQKKRSSLHTICDLQVLNWQMPIRAKSPTLFSAGKMAKALLSSQLPEKPSPKLYALFAAYLQHLPICKSCSVIEGSFLLKLLLHEGLIDLQDRCCYCHKNAVGLSSGVSVCLHHLDANERFFSEDDWKMVFILGKARRFSQLSACKELANLPRFLQDLWKQFFGSFF